MLRVIFGAIFTDTIGSCGKTAPAKQLFMAGIIAVGVLSRGFQGLSINVVQERESGLIRRLATSPMPKPAHFIAKVVRVLVTTVVEVAIFLLAWAAGGLIVVMRTFKVARSASEVVRAC